MVDTGYEQNKGLQARAAVMGVLQERVLYMALVAKEPGSSPDMLL